MVAEMTDGSTYAFQLPTPFDRDFATALYASDGEHYISATTSIYEIDGVPYIRYYFDFSYLAGANVALMAVDFFSTTCRIVPDVQNTICMWDGPGDWTGYASTSFVYNTVVDTVSLYESEWKIETEARSYSGSYVRGRVSFSPVRPAIVTSVNASVNLSEPNQFFTFYVPVLDPRNPESGLNETVSVWDAYISKQNVVEIYASQTETVWDAYISKQNVVESSGLPNGLDWFADMAKGILELQLLPGITIGGLVFAFIAIPLVVAFLKLFAGG